MQILDVEDSREVLARYPYLRVTDIPVEGLLLVNESMILSADSEGQVTLFSLDPNYAG